MIHRFKHAVSNAVNSINGVPPIEDSDDDNDFEKRPKFIYNRPHFLHLTAEEAQVSSDHSTRPILVPRDVTNLPWRAGYAEVVNGGKTSLNEDQARAEILFVPKKGEAKRPLAMVDSSNVSDDSKKDNCDTEGAAAMSKSSLQDFKAVEDDPLPFNYFAIFDGHAGTGAALMASHFLHIHVQEQLSEIRQLLIARRYAFDSSCSSSPATSPSRSSSSPAQMDRTSSLSADSLIIGALEAAFFQMDEHIRGERRHFDIKGGCAAIVALFFMGKLYVANAGDCRAVLCRGNHIEAQSRDFTPQSDRRRIQSLAKLSPELLKNEFTHLEFARRVTSRDLGKKVLCRDGMMSGWAYKTITEDDIKFPIIWGDGKKARVLATIGVTRGFGDFDLKVYDSNIYIKPFLTPAPEVHIYDVSAHSHTENDVLIMGSDGLWDVVKNEKAVEVVRQALVQYKEDDPMRYTLAAQDLVLQARGILDKRIWRRPDHGPSSYDDITAFVIPLHIYGQTATPSSSMDHIGFPTPSASNDQFDAPVATSSADDKQADNLPTSAAASTESS